MRVGNVALVGAGPGHIDFLTIAGLKAIKKAQVILYDALLAPDIRRLFPRQAKAVYVGKRCGQHALKQSQINELLVSYARDGFDVVRLKGGDPFVFGRGAEEVQALREAAIPYRIIPGISALNGIAAQVGLPLTSRTHSNEFRAIQGHLLPDDPSFWEGLAFYQGTLVIFMGIENLPKIALRLSPLGADDKLVAIIETDEQGQALVTRTSILSILGSGFERKSRGPGIVYIGPNVGLMDEQALSYTTRSEMEENSHETFAHIP